jgi:hypothetical protein
VNGYSSSVFIGLTGVAGNPGAWIGLRDVTGTNIYQWIQNNTPMTFNFLAVPPTIANNCANYIANALVNNPTISWATTPCNTAMSFICELEPPCSEFVPTVRA